MAIKVQGDTVIFDDKVFRPGRFTTAERLSISDPSNGMVVFDTDRGKFFLYNGSNWEQIISKDEVLIETPTITVEGAPSDVPENPTISTSAFTVTIVADSHESTDWEIRRTSNNEVVFTSLNDINNLTSITIPEDVLEVSTEYEFRARHRSATDFVSNFGTTTANTAASFFNLTSFGESGCGGFYIGAICAAGQCYALIVSPNASGCAQCQWKTTRTATAGTTSTTDGFSNTYGPMDNAGHPAGNWTATRTINGFSDWYFPAKDELNQLYVNDGGTTNTTLPAGEGFAAVIYWSSTELSATSACFQNFSNGSQTSTSKAYSGRVRAVRREPI